ncbi:MAG: aminotransferase class I/II-fold pyridoxal phosphate-dependent enzyme [Gemmatales bacterium]|nr:aminotransferase class I/II-fold pyridoxal phosphate-dependent enzyme [Gemmatales bacterium]MDW8176472.1 aminotransferase class I/II-fold pyridoxal phosphate-dependent enzyme [Gemmatales bacterium]
MQKTSERINERGAGPEQPQEVPFVVRVADRVQRLPPYLFAKINALKQQRRREGRDIIDLGMGNPTDVPDPVIIEKLCDAARDERNHRYSVSVGLHNLRREVARRYERQFGVALDAETEVIACLGSKEAFSHMCLALVGPGDTAIVPAPSFPIHVYGIYLASGNVISLPCTQPEQFLSQVATITERLYPRPKLLVLNYPHNPTGTVVERDFFVEVVHLARRYGLMVIHDFAYGDIGFDGYQPPSFLSVPGAKTVGVETTTMSKGYNMAGWRIGFCAGNAEMIRALATIKGYYDYGIFQAIQIAAIVALRECEEAVRRQALVYQRRRDLLVEGLRRGGWELQTPRAGMFVWAKYPATWQHLDSMTFAMKLLEEADVAVSPGRGFGEAGEGYVRLALVENEQRLRQAVRQIHRCLRTESPWCADPVASASP